MNNILKYVIQLYHIDADITMEILITATERVGDKFAITVSYDDTPDDIIEGTQYRFCASLGADDVRFVLL